MKKTFLLVVLVLFLPLSIKAETFYAGDNVLEVPIYLDKITKQSYRYFKTAYRKSDDVLVYCVEPEKLLSIKKNYIYITENQWEKLNISKEKWRRLELLGYFGYGYKNHNDLKWAAITQYMIWQTVLPEGWFLTFTDGYEGEFKNIHEKETYEIEELIKNFETKPSFENNNYKISKNDKLVLNDTNKVLSHYKLTSSSDLKVKIDKNNLVIEGNKNGTYTLEFTRGDFKPTKLYLSDTDQMVIATDGEPEISFKINVVVESGSLKIERGYDNYLENDSKKENATYEITDSRNNTYILSTDQDGVINLSDLPTGEIVIKELVPSEGYYPDKNTYKATIKDDEEFVLELDPVLIKKKVNIIKKYLMPEENLLPAESNSVFTVTKNASIKLKDKTDENGLVSFAIPYGNYTITQNSTLLDYELMEDYNIVVLDDKEEFLTFINYPTPVIEEEPEEIPEVTPDETEEVTPEEKDDKPEDEKIPAEDEKEPEEVPENSEQDLEEDTGNKNEEHSDENLEEPDNEKTENNKQNLNYNERDEEEIIKDENIIENDNLIKEEEKTNISNPKTNDNIIKYLLIFWVSLFGFGKITQKMQ